MTTVLPPVWDYNKPLALCMALGETPQANAALVAYYELGLDRSHAQLVKQFGKKPSYIRFLQLWSSKYDWVARVARAQEIDTEERHKAARQIWAHKQTEWRGRLEELAGKLAERANEMLAQQWYAERPQRINRIVQDGQAVIHQTLIIQPVKTLPRDAATFAQASATLAKLAVGLSDAPTVNLNLTPQDLAAMSDEQLAETIAKLQEGL